VIVDDILLNYSKGSHVWKLLFQWILLFFLYAAYYDVSMRSDIFSNLRHVIWILVIQISDLGTRICKAGLSHQHDILLRLLWFTLLHVSYNNWSLSDN